MKKKNLKNFKEFNENLNNSENNNFLLENKELRDKKSLFSEDSGFDTPKKLNRSNRIVPVEILEEIERGITIERLDELDLPIFKYKTQITIHGIFDELSNQRIGGYKLIFQNKNKSIGIKWNAIDYDKKVEIYSVMKRLGYSISLTSNNFYAYKMLSYNEENYNKLKEEYNKIDDSLYVGTKDIFVGTIPFVGKVLMLKIDINAIYSDDVWNFITKSFDMTRQDWELKKEEERREKERKDKEFEKEMLSHKQEREQRKKEKIEEYKQKYKLIEFHEIPDNDCIMLYIDDFHREILIKKFNKGDDIIYQRMLRDNYKKGFKLDDINKRLRKYDTPESYIRKNFMGNDVFLVKVFGDDKVDKVVVNKVKKFDDFKGIQVLDYSDRAVIVIGDTKNIKDKLKSMGGRFNKFLKHPETGDRVVGWVFPKSKKELLLNL